MKQNNDFQWSIQIPTFLSHEKCDEILETIKKSEQNTIGCVGDVDDDGNPLENQIIPNVRKTTEYYLLPQKDNEFRPDQPNNDWNWLLDKISMMVNMVNDKIYHFDIETNDGELKMIEYEKGGHYTWHADFNPGRCSLRKLVAIVQLTDPSEYEGGDVQFGFQDEKTDDWFKMNKLKGSLTIFPAFLSHRVTPVTKGKRYVIQELFVGDHFR
tara:strand:+ start:17 stop:652 length:636 start_codon:yes stop_codon:yes gene_type:complete